MEANNATIKAMPSGTSIRPSIPVRKKSGTKLTTMISVELRMGMRTSREALKTTSKVGLCSPMGRSMFSLIRLYTF